METRLRDIDLQTEYHRGASDIAGEFFIPCMRSSSKYDRAVGYFSSTVYTIAWSGLKDFILNGGRIRLVCSHVLKGEDAEALEEGHRTAEEVEANLRRQLTQLLDEPRLRQPTRLLATLVAMGRLEVRIAFMGAKPNPRAKRIFHDKLGVFTDTWGDSVSFRGSMNETFMGLSNHGNFEAVEVFVSWGTGREGNRVDNHKSYFDTLWEGGYPDTPVKPFPEALKEELLKIADPAEWEELANEVQADAEETNLNPRGRNGSRSLLPHQQTALVEWTKRGRRGILEHATGSGKTFTAVSAMREAVLVGEVPIVLVPGRLLMRQWSKDIDDVLGDLRPAVLKCGDGHDKWKDDGLLPAWTSPRGQAARVVLATMQTASKPEFYNKIRSGSHLFVVADEVHRLGSAHNRQILDLESGPRLGLSATPRRAGDPEGTASLMRYFAGVVEPPFTLRDAIESKRLVEYFYHVYTVELTAVEQARWDDLSQQIDQLVAREHSRDIARASLAERIKMLAIERAQVAKEATAKTDEAVRIIRNRFAPGDRWLVYCSDRAQLNLVLEALRETGLEADEYHRAMRGDEDRTLAHFKSVGGVLVAIKCLDEGVDIPVATHALILASSKNPREFIQRRGRVLRAAPGKNVAHVFDVLAVPKRLNESSDMSLVAGELARAILFGSDARNPSSITHLKLIAQSFGLDLSDVAESGYEEDDDHGEE